MANATADLLRDAKALLGKNDKDKKQKYAASDKDGNPVDVTSEDATSFSVWGALNRAAYDRRDSSGIDTALVLLGQDGIQDQQLAGWSNLPADEVGKRFDAAIERADGGPAVPPTEDEEETNKEEKSDEQD